jgi:hypothetical protein
MIRPHFEFSNKQKLLAPTEGNKPLDNRANMPGRLAASVWRDAEQALELLLPDFLRKTIS